MSKKRHLLPVLVSLGAATLPACDDKTAVETGSQDEPVKKKKKAKTTKPKPAPTIVRDPDHLPPRLGGAVAPAPPPSAVPSNAPRAPRAQAAPGAAAPAAEAPAAETPGVAIVHNHGPDEPCSALTEDELKKALADLRGTAPDGGTP